MQERVLFFLMGGNNHVAVALKVNMLLDPKINGGHYYFSCVIRVLHYKKWDPSGSKEFHAEGAEIIAYNQFQVWSEIGVMLSTIHLSKDNLDMFWTISFGKMEVTNGTEAQILPHYNFKCILSCKF